MQQVKVLLVEDDPGLREAVYDTLSLANYQVTTCDNAESALSCLNQEPVDIVLSDIQMPGLDGLQLLQIVRNKFPQLPFVLMTAYAQIEDAVKAMRGGASDYLAKPFAPDVLLNLLSRFSPVQDCSDENMPIVADEQSKKLVALSKRVANTDATVMVLGPSGSGKEVLARYIHSQSARKKAPFVAINCAAIPENMLEATLFGYEKGAFTGAYQATAGKFEQAQGGTIMLDEVTEMALPLQAKLLRVLQEKEVERLGGRKTISLDVRVIATSNRDLMQTVREGKFREDLFYRLNVFPLVWLPLQERPEDILPLAHHLLSLHAHRQGQPNPTLSASAKHKLKHYHWPGNVRELENVVQRALILCDGTDIGSEDLLLDEPGGKLQTEPVASQVPQAESSLDGELRQQEHQIIIDMLKSCNGKRKDVAEKLGISARTLRYKLAQMRSKGIELPN